MPQNGVLVHFTNASGQNGLVLFIYLFYYTLSIVHSHRFPLKSQAALNFCPRLLGSLKRLLLLFRKKTTAVHNARERRDTQGLHVAKEDPLARLLLSHRTPQVSVLFQRNSYDRSRSGRRRLAAGPAPYFKSRRQRQILDDAGDVGTTFKRVVADNCMRKHSRIHLVVRERVKGRLRRSGPELDPFLCGFLQFVVSIEGKFWGWE